MATKTKHKAKVTTREVVDNKTGELTLLAVGSSVGRIDPSKIKLKRMVTLPQLKIVDDVTYLLRFTAPMYTGKEIIAAPGKKQMEAPTLAQVHVHGVMEGGGKPDVMLNAPMLIVVHAVAKSELENTYPNADYVGRDFMYLITKLEGKRYKQAQIGEIDVSGAEALAN